MPKQIPLDILKNQVYGKLSILEELDKKEMKDGKFRRQFLCQCTCGNTTIVLIGSLRSGHIRSCGCGHRETLKTCHGFSKGKLRKFYMSWWDMVDRCTNPESPAFKHYGGRGITCPDEWLEIENFAKDMLSGWKEGLTIERVNVNLPYSKENCVWATMSTQIHNRRKFKNTTSRFKGVWFSKAAKKWSAMIEKSGSGRFYLGLFETEEEAARAYNLKSLELFGDAPNIFE